MQLRVISGTARGKKLKVPEGNIRPLSDRAKESLFNILMPVISESEFLDLFAGSGSVGIEALSRGASHAVLVELDRRSVMVIRENLENTGFFGRAEVMALPVERALKILNKKDAGFDIIFLGAPYGSRCLYDALDIIGSQRLLKPAGIVIAEHRFKSVIDDTYGDMARFRQERYGDTVFTFYRNKG